MRITVFGAAGDVGSRVVAEAAARGHEVTGAVRDPARSGGLHPAATAGVGDAASVADVVRLSAGRDVVITATRPAPGRESELVTTTSALLAGVARGGARLLVVGGAATLAVPGAGGTTVLDDPRFLPAAARPIALACVAQLAACRAETRADWAYLSPPREPGTGGAHRHLPDRRRRAAGRPGGQLGHLDGGPRGGAAGRGRAAPPPPCAVHRRMVTGARPRPEGHPPGTRRSTRSRYSLRCSGSWSVRGRCGTGPVTGW